MRVAQARPAQLLGVSGISHESRHVGVEGREVQGVDAFRRDIDHHEAAVEGIERPGQQFSGLSETGDEQERLAESGHLPFEAL